MANLPALAWQLPRYWHADGAAANKKQLAGALAGAACTVLAFSPTLAERQPPVAAGFDPLFADGASCAPRQGRRPALLDQLVLAQAQTETAPFKAGRQAPARAAADKPLLYMDLGQLQVPDTTRNPAAQAYFNQGMRLTFAFNHAEAALDHALPTP